MSCIGNVSNGPLLPLDQNHQQLVVDFGAVMQILEQDGKTHMLRSSLFVMLVILEKEGQFSRVDSGSD